MILYRLRNICSLCRTPFLCNSRSTHASTKVQSEIEILTKQDPKISQNTDGITVASVENYSPISQVCVIVKAGTVNEKPENLGIVHCLRNSATLSTRNNSAFSITRGLEIKGSKLTVTCTREHIIYTLQCIRDEIYSGLELLSDVSTNNEFKTWEVKDLNHRMQLDLALFENNKEAVLLEALHKAAFRGGLSNSLYSPSFMIGKHNSEMLQDYVKEHFAASKMSLVGLGVNHDELQDAADKLFDVGNPSASDQASKFGGGQIRIEADIPYVHTAIVAEGTGLLNTKDSLSLGVLQCILGSGSHTKFGGVQASKLGEAATKCTNNPFAVSCLNVNYSSTGLFGVYICGNPDDMKEIVKSVVTQMRETPKSITDSDVQIAKQKLKAKLRLERENSKDLLMAMALEVSSFGQVKQLNDIEKTIDSLNLSDITTIAARVTKAKPAMAALGRLHSTPHFEELI